MTNYDDNSIKFYSDYVLNIGKNYSLGEILYGKYLNETKFAKFNKIIDIGAGRCWLAKSSKKSNVISIDYNKHIIKEIKKNCDYLEVIVGDVYKLPISNDSVDAINCHDLLEHMIDPEKIFLEFRRILRKGGYLYIAVPGVESLMKDFFYDYTHIRPYHPKGLAMLAKATGFSKVKTHYADFIAARFYPLNLMIEKYFGFKTYIKYMTALQKIPIKNNRVVILEAFK